MTQRWLARTRSATVARVLLYLLPFAALAMAVRVALESFPVGGMVVLAIVVVPAAIGTWWAWGRSRETVAVSIDGRGLTIAGYGRHALEPGSLHALRALEGLASDNTFATIVFVRLAGRSVALQIPSLLPDDRYASSGGADADLIFEHDAAELLERLLPHVMPADPSKPAAEVPTYSMRLRKRLPLPGGEARSLYIAGTTLALGGETPEMLASARIDEVIATPYCYSRLQTVDAPHFPDAPAVMLRFPRENIELSIGTSPPGLDEQWKHLPGGPSPEYLVGYGELVKLLAVLEGRRAPR